MLLALTTGKWWPQKLFILDQWLSITVKASGNLSAMKSAVEKSTCLACCYFFEVGLVCLLSGLQSNCPVCITVTFCRAFSSEKVGLFGSSCAPVHVCVFLPPLLWGRSSLGLPDCDCLNSHWSAPFFSCSHFSKCLSHWLRCRVPDTISLSLESGGVRVRPGLGQPGTNEFFSFHNHHWKMRIWEKKKQFRWNNFFSHSLGITSFFLGINRCFSWS